MKSGVLACGAVLSCLAGSAVAGSLVIELNTEYSGAAAPNGSAPWARATFTDKGGGVVGLVLECLLQDPTEFMAKANGNAGWCFNLDPALSPGNLTFTNVGTGADRTASSIQTGVNAFQAGPDRWYDIVFQFGQSGLKGGDIARYDLSISGGGLLASSFDYVTMNGPVGMTGFHSSAHVQGIGSPSSGQGGSGWVGGGTVQPIPLPSAGVIGLAGLGALATRRRRAL